MSKKKPSGSLKNYVPHFTPFHSAQNHTFLLFLEEEIHLRLPFTPLAFIKIAPLRGQTEGKKLRLSSASAIIKKARRGRMILILTQ